MKQFTLSLSTLCLLLSACSGGGGSSAGGSGTQNNKGVVSEWQVASLGQEGHGGDAIVCFNIPIEQALYKVEVGNHKDCPPGSSCSENKRSSNDPGSSTGSSPGSSSGIVWRMTDEGRKAIRSAKPLEQYVAESSPSKKLIVEQLNQMSVQKGYETVLRPFTKLPAAFSRISLMHKKLGWLHDDGIASEYGLIDINDSGWLKEGQIDTTRCKELQAVVRRDNQLWYDTDIVSHFDNAGMVLIQIHEEIYAWAKLQDKMNWEIPGPEAHQTSTPTRRLILKILDKAIDEKLANEHLKDLGFSTMYWETLFKVPTSVGYYMDTDSCIGEQKFLRDFFKGAGYGRDFWLKVETLFTSRYLKGENTQPTLQLRYNFPDALSNMIALTMNHSGSDSTFAAEIMHLQQIFERPESCVGTF